MGIPNAKRYTITHPETGDRATLVAVIPKGEDLDAYLMDASRRFDWKAWTDQKGTLNKVRVGQQKQQKRK
jgi:hypothetical protein